MTRRDAFKKSLATLMDNKPEARLVENRYRAIKYVLRPYFPTLFETLSEDAITQLLQDVVYLDRQVRKVTEGVDEEKKEILSQEYQLKELGMEVSYLTRV